MNDLNIGVVPTSDAVSAALLSRLAYNLDLTPTQYSRAQSAYETVAEVLASDSRPELKNSKVFPQGSFALGTVVKPLNDSDEGFDVDLICRLASSDLLTPAQAKGLVGSCLAADGRYKDKLREKARCWRVVYSGEFHLDVAPVVPNNAGGDLIPDRQLRVWIPTDPERYALWFNELAEKARTTRLVEALVLKAEVAPFPDDPADRGWLRRLVQLLKRHRCIWQNSLPEHLRGYAPISIIITTLTTYVFKKIHEEGQFFSSALDLIRSIVARMPSFVEQRVNAMGEKEWWVPSPVAAENFANRWNADSEWSKCFFAWRENVAQLLDRLRSADSIDERVNELREAFGDSAAKGVAREYGDYMLKVRQAGDLRLTTAGLAVSTQKIGTSVAQHTNFGG